MTIFWIGCGLTSIGTHCHAMAHAVRAAATRQAVDLAIVTPRSAAASAVSSVGARPILSQSVYDTSLETLDRRAAFDSAMEQLRIRFRGDLVNAIVGTGPRDTVILVTPMAPELTALADWFESLSVRKRPHLAAYCVLPVGFRVAADWQRAAVAGAYRAALQRLDTLTEHRFTLYCENRQIADELSPLTSRSILWPHVFSSPEATAIQSQGRPYVLALGANYRARQEKGFSLILDLLRTEAARRVPFDWVVQAAPMYRQTPPGCHAKNIRFILELPDHNEYWSLLSNAALIVLPYDPVAYGDGRSSGIFREALHAGVPTVCSTAPFFVEELTGRGVPDLLFEPYTSDALFQKISQTMSDIERFRRIFATFAGTAPHAPDAFLRHLSTLGSDAARQ